MIADVQKSHEADFAGFDIEFDNYGSTNSPESRAKCEEIWKELRAKDMVVEEEIEQLFDVEKGIFLADRFIKGKCPKCQSPDQLGDACVKCNATYDAIELIDPVSTYTGSTPEVRTVNHLFIEIEQLHGFLEEWTQSGTLPDESANYLKNFFLNGKG